MKKRNAAWRDGREKKKHRKNPSSHGKGGKNCGPKGWIQVTRKGEPVSEGKRGRLGVSTKAGKKTDCPGRDPGAREKTEGRLRKRG